MRKNCLIIFVKSPIPGQVKTRLSPPLSLKGSCQIYQAFVHDILKMTSRIPVECKMVAYSGDLDHFKKIIPSHFNLIPQGEGDLGDRLSRVFKWCIQEGFSRIVILGSDAPSLPNEFVENAFQLLGKNDLVLGPSWDGGYYLIGLKGSFIPLFKGISWSTRKTLLQTLLKAKKLKKKVEILSSWYDVDSYGDLRFLSLDFLCARSLRVNSARTYKIMSSLGLLGNHHRVPWIDGVRGS